MTETFIYIEKKRKSDKKIMIITMIQKAIEKRIKERSNFMIQIIIMLNEWNIINLSSID